MFKWFKYTKIAVEMDGKFRDVYNFHLPAENKSPNVMVLLGMSVIFETSRIHQFNPEDMTYLLKRLDSKTNALVQFINPTGMSDFVEWDAYERLYISYNNFRAKGVRPVVSTMLAYQSEDGVVSQEEVEQYVAEYESNPIFGSGSGL